MSNNPFLKKAAGLFFNFDDEQQAPAEPVKTMSDEEFRQAMAAPVGATKTVAQILKDSPGPNLDDIKAPAEPAQLQTMGADGTVDYNAIYTMANITSSPFTAEQLLDLLNTLPPELPLESRRQTVKITIQAMAKTVAVTPELIVADASRKLAALAAYADGFSKQADDFVANSEKEIAALQTQIEAKKHAIDDAKQKQTKMVESCTAESHRLDDVLEFFSLDVPPSKYAK